jgi:tetratricopeptide (TPR) repeat protein
MNAMRKLASPTLALLLIAALPSFAPAMNGETDQGVLQAERTLRAAEARELDPTAMSLYRQAIAEAEAALERNPNSAGANFVYFAARGRILLADGLTKNLIELRELDRKHLDRAIELDPRYFNAIAAKGGVLLDLPRLLGGDPAEGLRLLRRANQLNPGGPGTRVSLAKALARNGHIEEAKQHVRIAAHHACIQGRRKALDDAVALSEELGMEIAQARPRASVQ